jgi:hypothetical protein
MNKEEILAKAKQENVYGDEREKTVRTRRDAFSCWGVLILGIIIMIIKISQGQSPADIIAIFFCMSGMGFTYEGIKLKKKWVIIVAVILLLLAAYSFYKFCEGIF